MRLFIRLLTGLFFIASAILKLMDIDVFENYIYSLHLFGLNTSSIAARLIIGVELALGFLLVFNLFFRFTVRFALLLLLLFSVFLAYQIIGGNEGNCHCLGELIDFSPQESLLKNTLFILLLLVIRNIPNTSFRFQGALFTTVLVVTLAVPFVASPPDFFDKDRYLSKVQYDQQKLDQLFEEGMLPARIGEGKRMLCFYSPQCRYCKMTANRVGTLAENMDIGEKQVFCVFWGSGEDVPSFYEENNSPQWDFITVGTEPFLDVTKGRFPLILLIKDGKAVYKMDYRSLDEDKIAEFFSNSDNI